MLIFGLELRLRQGEQKGQIRDRITVALAFVLPLAVLLIYGYAIRLEAKNIPLSIQDFDNSFLSRTYAERLFATNQFIPVPLEDNDPIAALDRAGGWHRRQQCPRDSGQPAGHHPVFSPQQRAGVGPAGLSGGGTDAAVV